MELKYQADKLFEKSEFNLSASRPAEFENCHFKNCDFSSVDLSNSVFTDCVFTDCNLSLVRIHKTAFRDTKFVNCKMLGLKFEHSNAFGLSFSFDNCVLNLCSFYQTKIKQTNFLNCLLQEVDFTETDMSGSILENCDLAKAIFIQTNLEKVDLRTSYNYSIDPEINRIKKAKFALQNIAGLLDKYDIDIEI